MSGAIEPLLQLMARLRDPVDGCPWDRVQDFASIAPYTIEEAYEVADAIARGDLAALKDELGDLLLQVVFHAHIAQDRGAFAFTDVVASIVAKMERRHPHIFAGNSPLEEVAADSRTVVAGWEAIKAAERQAGGDTGALSGVAMALPALMRAQKLQKRAARVGFDWDSIEDVAAKVLEELSEVASTSDADEREEEVGDLLFAVVNLARHHGVDAEVALRRANDKFARRFRSMEAAEPDFAALDAAAKERAWIAVKQAERD